jgi:glycosyltransferase involved in cell wall biosynthesis
MTVDILMITWNRFDYAKRTIDNLLSTNDDFHIYWWDNGSVDGVAEYISGLDDKRIVLKHRSDSNVMQAIPTRWFLEQSRAAIIGKLDDDTLVPDGWIKTIGSAIEQHNKLGMVGCWTFWPEDFERNSGPAQKKIKTFGAHRILTNIGIGGTAFLMKKKLALKYLVKDHNGTAFPIDRERMSAGGYCSGWYFPLIWAEHMDDPRSAYCVNRDDSSKNMSALSAKVRGFKTRLEFLDWIKTDADKILASDTSNQISKYKFNKSFTGKVINKIARHPATRQPG